MNASQSEASICCSQFLLISSCVSACTCVLARRCTVQSSRRRNAYMSRQTECICSLPSIHGTVHNNCRQNTQAAAAERGQLRSTERTRRKKTVFRSAQVSDSCTLFDPTCSHKSDSQCSRQCVRRRGRPLVTMRLISAD